MYVMGISMGQTRDKQNLLKDGGACLLIDGRVEVAIAEERLTREAHAGGFERSLEYCLNSTGLTLNDLDLIVASSCSEELLPTDFDPGLGLKDKSKIKIIPSHHLSHAYSAFAMSPFEQATVMIIDNEGNIIGPRLYPEFWLNRLERNSYYLGIYDKIALLPTADDDLNSNEIGLGEAYRYFTYFLGWDSYVYSGKTMGLAPYGHRETFENVEVFNLDQGKLKCLMPNKHKNPIQAVVDFGRTQGVDFGPPRQSGADYTQRYCDIAFLIQDRLEKALVNKANHLHKLTGSKNLCIAGGVGLNCVANREILNNTPFERIFIQPAAGDSGQCLGNALYGYHYLLGKPRREVMTHAYFGKEYSNTDVMNALERWSGQVIYERMQNPATQVAALLSEGNVIGWFQFGSELGPRALGHRSILADPRQPAMQDFINAIVKHREPFRPYAPSVLLEHSNEFFDLPCPSPFMLLTARVYPHKRSTIPAVTHVDGTARVQTVTKEDNGIYYDLIQAFYKKTGIPLLLNTSFNLAGEAIVETPNDALNSFMKTQMDYLVIHEYLVRKVKHLDIPLFKIWVEGTPI